MRRLSSFLHHFISNLRKAWIMSGINADLDTCAAIVAGLPAKIQAAEAVALANAEAETAPKVANVLAGLQALDASVTPTASTDQPQG